MELMDKGGGMKPTRRQLEVLAILANMEEVEEGELVYERGMAYLGYERVASRTVFALLRMCAISADSFQSGDIERYRINDTGRQILGRYVGP